MSSSPQDTASYLLHDLGRWTFGELLARRAQWACLDLQGIEAAVQAYRLAILQAVLKAAGPEQAALALAVEAQRKLTVNEHAPYTQGPKAWEGALASHFLDRLRARAPFGEAKAPLTRFAHGQYFKYSRRVAYLLKLPPVLPCRFAPPAPPTL